MADESQANMLTNHGIVNTEWGAVNVIAICTNNIAGTQQN